MELLRNLALAAALTFATSECGYNPKSVLNRVLSDQKAVLIGKGSETKLYGVCVNNPDYSDLVHLYGPHKGDAAWFLDPMVRALFFVKNSSTNTENKTYFVDAYASNPPNYSAEVKLVEYNPNGSYQDIDIARGTLVCP